MGNCVNKKDHLKVAHKSFGVRIYLSTKILFDSRFENYFKSNL